MDNWCPQGHRPVKFDEPTKESNNSNKNSSWLQEPKARAPQRFNNAEISEKAWKEKINNRRHQRSYPPPQDWRPREGSTSAIWVNDISTSGGGNSRKNQNRGSRQDSAQATCWNCDKKGNHANKCPEPLKAKNYYRSWQSLRRWLVLVRRLQRWSWIGFPVFTTCCNSEKIRKGQSFELWSTPAMKLTQWLQPMLSS